ncbi:VOC family protein [Daejeonella sp. JGW-45]|uniref:VOC family protein n=1 Tax=Daejeonella sp. JGW-45 TaxID=3034148 RepID=UPI0023ECE832|nr:VOC family protein [Daejeonella sp. JGW-45]
MKARISVLTLGVADLAKAVTFYQNGLGLKTEGIVGQEFEYGAVAFFDLQNGLRLALWPKESISKDTGIPVQEPSSLEFTIGHNVNTKEEVDAVMIQAKTAGAKIIKPAQNTFYNGYAGYFQDPDGHLWEVVWNPEFQVEE